jgi:hypothetical protein
VTSDSLSRREEKRLERLKLLDDHIGEHLRESAASGELASAPSWGKPLRFGDGYDETPVEFRMAMKILKDAHVVPPEVEAMRRLADLRTQAAAAADPGEARALRQQASELQQAIALRLERLRGGSL